MAKQVPALTKEQFQDWHRIMGFKNMRDGAEALGITVGGYHRIYHEGTNRRVYALAMMAVHEDLPPWNEKE